MSNRTDLLKAARQAKRLLVNDVHAQLNPTLVDRIVSVHSVETILAARRDALRDRKAICIAGGRHAMGGQQFGESAVLLDMRPLNHVLGLDSEKGIVEVEAGIEWPELVGWLVKTRVRGSRQWGIAQKQTGADRLSLGGALAANAHGRGLTMRPFIDDVESFELIDASGATLRCSRSENPELFRLAAGGYGLFGIVTSVRLRLAPRQKLERIVEVVTAHDLMPAFQRRIAEGFLYGDFQFAVNEASEDFLRKGIFSCYRPVDPATPVPAHQRELSEQDWGELLYLAHANREEAFQRYSRHYLATSGQIYWSDTHQMSTYLDDYHRALDRRLGATDRATEMITEISVPRDALEEFLNTARDDFRSRGVEVIYGTVRLIEPDGESFLVWARQPYACVIFNLHVVHTEEGLVRAAGAFRRLIDLGIDCGGCYYLTYHRYATRDQLLSCYPQFPEFLRLKKMYDPGELFQSEWYRHHKTIFADEPSAGRSPTGSSGSMPRQ